MSKMIKITDLSKSFYTSDKKQNFYALRDINLYVEKNKTTAIIGESGSGKTTIGKIIAGILEPSSGSIEHEGRSFNDFNEQRKSIQMIFQDPWTSLDPYWRAKDIILEGVRNILKPTKNEEKLILKKWLKACGFKDEDKDKYPHQFSGGQRQRLAIARALALTPDFLICDEILSALDASVKGRLLNILFEEFKKNNKTLLFIAHDLDIVQMISDRIVVMLRGRVAEEIPRVDDSFSPKHPYSIDLFKAVPILGEKVKLISKNRANLLFDNKTCPYASICKRKIKECEINFPPVSELADNHRLFCYNPKEDL